jgi:hypothetical protein
VIPSYDRLRSIPEGQLMRYIALQDTMCGGDVAAGYD